MALLRTPVAVAVAPLPVAMAVLKPPLAVAVVFGPIPIARSPRSVVVQVLPPVPEPLLKPPADAQLALASPAELSAPMANAPDASAPSSTPPPSRTQSLPPARTALCLPMICLASDIASLLVVAGHGGYGLDLRMIDLPWRAPAVSLRLQATSVHEYYCLFCNYVNFAAAKRRSNAERLLQLDFAQSHRRAPASFGYRLMSSITPMVIVICALLCAHLWDSGFAHNRICLHTEKSLPHPKARAATAWRPLVATLARQA